jgi:hypothetical protein
MKNQNQIQPISTQTNKLTSKSEEPPPVTFQWNDNKDELGMEDDWEPENFKNLNEEQSEYIEPLS